MYWSTNTFQIIVDSRTSWYSTMLNENAIILYVVNKIFKTNYICFKIIGATIDITMACKNYSELGFFYHHTICYFL